MRTFYYLLLIAGIFTLNAACKTTQQQDASSPDMTHLETKDNLEPSLSLSDHLRKLPGVSVVNNGGSIVVTMKGFKSFEGHREPLFVVDGKMFTGGYEAVVGAVDVNDIESIRVLRDINERAQYGFRGANGVIEIRTKG